MTGNVTKTDGLNYLFMMMSANYGATFIRHWDGSDMQIVKQFWIDTVGDYLTYKPALDYALKNMNPTYVPSALELLSLCKDFGKVPVENKYYAINEQNEISEEQKRNDMILAEHAREFLNQFVKRNKGPKSYKELNS